MVRSMYSGVVGMRAQQTAMDTIGNNIANVKTYGYKASRTTFKDVYYQTLKSGSTGTSNKGGTNPSQIGYGAQVGSIDVLHGQSSFAMTGRSMDMAIAGEGFFQVQDSDGNTFFTRAGQLLFDPAGNLVDSNGNFVLGVSGDPLGKTGSSDRIQLNIPPVSPATSKVTETINSKKINISASKEGESGNVGFSFQTDESIPSGKYATAIITGGGTGITIKLRPGATFGTIGDLQKEVNAAIKEANGGVEHPSGQFNFSMENAASIFGTKGLTGEEIVSKDYSVTTGKFNGATAADKWPADVFGGMTIEKTDANFNGTGAVTFEEATFVPAKAPNPDMWSFKMKVGTETYEGSVLAGDTKPGQFILKGIAPATGEITMNHPGFTALAALDAGKTGKIAAPAKMNTTTGEAGDITINATPSTPSRCLGFGSNTIKLDGGTEGGTQTIANLESIMVSADGVITAKHGVHGEIPVGRLDIVTFANPQGLVQSGNTYFAAGPNSGVMNKTQPGRNGSGELVTGSLEQSSVDLSQEFSDMITTQRAYQANSRIITVSDTMLEELVNLKR